MKIFLTKKEYCIKIKYLLRFETADRIFEGRQDENQEF